MLTGNCDESARNWNQSFDSELWSDSLTYFNTSGILVSYILQILDSVREEISANEAH